MEFDGATQKLKCNHCGFSISVDEYESQSGKGDRGQGNGETSQAFKDKDTDNRDAKQGDREAEKVKVYHCQSCGAELVADKFTSATICGFCGNPSLVEDRLTGDFMPSLVIPFKIDKEGAKSIYRGWVKKGPLTPKALSSKSTIEKITGVYVPFWLYDFNAQDNMQATATRTRTERHGDYQYIYTDHYSVYRSVRADFDKIPADASEKMPDDAMDKLEPFHYQEMIQFQMPYLSGYFSEKYNFTSDQIENRARNRVNDYITDITRGTINGYSTVSVLENQVSATNLNDEYALFPVWMLNYRYNGKNFQFMLNGQTGKIVADRPISKKRALAWFAGISVGTFIITLIGGILILWKRWE